MRPARRLRRLSLSRSHHGTTAHPKSASWRYQPAEARPRHVSHAGRRLPRRGPERAGDGLPAPRHRRDVWQRGSRRRRDCGLRGGAQGAACHHQGLEREPGAGRDAAGVRCVAEEAPARPDRSLSGALAGAANEPAADVRDVDAAEARGPHPRHRRRQFQHRAAENRGRGNRCPDRLQPGRIPRDAGPDPAAPVSHCEIDSAGGLLSAGAGQGGFRPGACGHRAQAQCHRGAGRAEMAARSGRRRRDPEGLARGKPAGQSRCARASIWTTPTGRRSRPCPRTGGV